MNYPTVSQGLYNSSSSNNFSVCECAILCRVFNNGEDADLSRETEITVLSLARFQQSLPSFILKQEKDSFTRTDLNSLSDKLVLVDPNKEHQTWIPIFKPHHNAITGNYDINVLISALEEKGKTVVWHDRRNGASSIDINRSDDILMGIVLNIPVRKFGGLWKSRHWVALRRIEGIWYNLDSDFKSPQPFKDADEVKQFIGFHYQLRRRGFAHFA
ncbi:Machado-Joseph disease protein MJD [Macleaya cordata]|uniref:ubiquitinyl hydrolase 1 n=1 Tax=Macleaya cordata TaxID=56857 RepID=A0A200QLT0_MACCD|nr:Machado-Joseph disease protein MJD [Macleaya cordata]